MTPTSRWMERAERHQGSGPALPEASCRPGSPRSGCSIGWFGGLDWPRVDGLQSCSRKPGWDGPLWTETPSSMDGDGETATGSV